MVRKDKHVRKNGTVTQIRVVEGYRDATGKSKQRTIKNFGYLEDQFDQEAFLAEVYKFDEEYKNDKTVLSLKIKSQKTFLDEEAGKCKNFGYRYLESIIDSLNLESVFNKYPFKGNHSLYEIFKFLVISRILNPDSKRATFQVSKSLYGKAFEFNLYDLYRSLDHFANLFDAIQQETNKSVSNITGRKTDVLFFDTTNFFFERDLEDDDQYIEIKPMITDVNEIKKLKLVTVNDKEGKPHQYLVIPGLAKKGVSKDHKVDPIVQMGLLMDGNGIPMCMQVFPGNTSDSLTTIPILEKVKKEYGIGTFILTADKGINTSKTIDYLINTGNDYMFSQILKGKKGNRYKDRLFDDSLYTVVSDDYKYQLFTEEYPGIDKDGNQVMRKRKVLIYWNGKAAKRDAKKRQEKLNKASKSTENNAYLLTHGYQKYVKVENYVDDTGEVANRKVVTINHEKAENDSKYDGYFAIVTSRLDLDEPKIREMYHGLWRIEDSFRVTKSDLTARPVFVKTDEHIKSHFLICYISLVTLRILQTKMQYELSTERIKRALSSCSCSEITKGVIHCFLANTFEEYESFTKNNKKYYALTLNENKSETVEDFKKIMDYYVSTPTPAVTNKSRFDKFIDGICLK